jgi:putative IMPACT (imprinted ancient) family translation regulator
LTDTVVVVVRYFGGTKLGVGGLIRAYSESAEAALRRAGRREGIPAVRILIRYPYSHTGVVMRALELAAGTGVRHGYSDERAAAELTAVVPAGAIEGLVDSLREQTSGEVLPQLLDGATLYRPLPATGSVSA